MITLKASDGVSPSPAPCDSKIVSSESEKKEGSDSLLLPVRHHPVASSSSLSTDSGLASVSEEHVAMAMNHQSQRPSNTVSCISQTSSISGVCSADEEDACLLSETTDADNKIQHCESKRDKFPAITEPQGWNDSERNNSDSVPETEVFATVNTDGMNNCTGKDQVSTKDFNEKPSPAVTAVQMRRARSAPPIIFQSKCLSSDTGVGHRAATIGADYRRKRFFDLVGCNDDGGDTDDLEIEDSDEEREEQSLVAAARKALLENADLDADFCEFCKELALSEDDILHSLSRKSMKISLAPSVRSKESCYSVSAAFQYRSCSDVNSLTVGLPNSRLNSAISKPSLGLRLSHKKSSSTSSVDEWFSRRPVSRAHGDVAVELSDLVNYVQPVKFKGFKVSP